MFYVLLNINITFEIKIRQLILDKKNLPLNSSIECNLDRDAIIDKHITIFNIYKL